jgi:hypothetical protein
MDLPKRLNEYAMTEGSWITCLALEYAGSGVLGALRRALTLIGGNAHVRTLGLRWLALLSRLREQPGASARVRSLARARLAAPPARPFPGARDPSPSASASALSLSLLSAASAHPPSSGLMSRPSFPR